MKCSILFVFIVIGCAVALPPPIFPNFLGNNKQVKEEQLTSFRPLLQTFPLHRQSPYQTQAVTLPTPKLRDALITAVGTAIVKAVKRLPKVVSGEMQVNENIFASSTTTVKPNLDEEIEEYLKRFE